MRLIAQIETNNHNVPYAGIHGAAAVPCSTCYALPPHPCLRPSGHVTRAGFGAFHAARRALAERVSLVGLICQDCSTPDGPAHDDEDVGHYVAAVADSEENHKADLPIGRLLCGPCFAKRVGTDPLPLKPKRTTKKHLKDPQHPPKTDKPAAEAPFETEGWVLLEHTVTMDDGRTSTTRFFVKKDRPPKTGRPIPLPADSAVVWTPAGPELRAALRRGPRGRQALAPLPHEQALPRLGGPHDALRDVELFGLDSGRPENDEAEARARRTFLAEAHAERSDAEAEFARLAAQASLIGKPLAQPTTTSKHSDGEAEGQVLVMVREAAERHFLVFRAIFGERRVRKSGPPFAWGNRSLLETILPACLAFARVHGAARFRVVTPDGMGREYAIKGTEEATRLKPIATGRRLMYTRPPTEAECQEAVELALEVACCVCAAPPHVTCKGGKLHAPRFEAGCPPCVGWNGQLTQARGTQPDSPTVAKPETATCATCGRDDLRQRTNGNLVAHDTPTGARCDGQRALGEDTARRHLLARTTMEAYAARRDALLSIAPTPDQWEPRQVELREEIQRWISLGFRIGTEPFERFCPDCHAPPFLLCIDNGKPWDAPGLSPTQTHAARRAGPTVQASASTPPALASTPKPQIPASTQPAEPRPASLEGWKPTIQARLTRWVADSPATP